MADPGQRWTGRYFQIELASADDGGGIRMTERPKLHLNWPAGERLSEQRKDSGTRDLAATPLVELDSGAELLHSLVRADGSKLSIPLGPAEAVAVDLIRAGRLPMGRTECGGRPRGHARRPRK